MEEEQQKKSSEIYFKVFINPIRHQHLIPAIRPSGLSILFVLASFMDKENKCFPTLKTIAKIAGIHNASSVQINIKRLSKTIFGGKPIIKIISPRTKENPTKHNVYILSDKIGFKIFKGEYDTTPIDSEIISYKIPVTKKSNTKKNNTQKSVSNNIQLHNKNQLLKEDLNVSNKQEASDVYKFSLRKKYKHLKEKIYDKAIGVHEFNPEYSFQHAVNIVTRHIDKLGEENWLSLLKIAEEHESLKTYLGVTYSVIEKNNTFEDAVEECASY